MSYIEDGLNTLAREVIQINKANGWNCLTPDEWEDPYKILALLALVGTEVSEAAEGFRNNDQENFAEELADVVIRVLDIAGGLCIDLDNEVKKKIAKNRKRGFRHGGKRV